MMDISPSGKAISSILKHDSKQTSYKIALVRAINDVALSYPDIRNDARDVAIPMRFLAEFWVAYYYPFVDPLAPIYQGKRPVRNGEQARDMAFRSELTAFRALWQDHFGGINNPADGFYAINELRLPRNQTTYPPNLQNAYYNTLKSIAKTIEMPIRYAGPAGQEWSIFEKPKRYEVIADHVVALPGTQPKDICLIVPNALWQAFRSLSLWIEALCLHEWCLFTERITQDSLLKLDRGDIYRLLTARPDNRRPLTWERNQVDILLMEGHQFQCPWTQKVIHRGVDYDLDHILPLAVYPINELWNLVPSDPEFNSHKKRDRLPSASNLHKAERCLTQTYNLYIQSIKLEPVLREDVQLRFGDIKTNGFPQNVAQAVMSFVYEIAEARNLAQF